ncbi:MAG: N-acetylmuramoyl-L-alanine amidase [Clostridia bacterium]|nr:N-acetylmuramoyl-L-alanine amidase [Clostridia bacterium]
MSISNSSIRLRTLTTVMSLVTLMSFFIPAVFRAGGGIGDVVTAVSVVQKTDAGSAAQTEPIPPLVILDAGHGGEDGGAVSADGVSEKTLNLSIVLTLGDMLEAAGVPVVYTRTEDNGLYDGASPGHRKMTDLKNRLAVRQKYPEAVFLSVHMNTFSAAQYHGMQVFYSKNDERSKLLADLIRETNRTYLQPDNERVCKAADSSIYLLDRSGGCAVLTECGFLSNPEEAASLSDPAYREKVAGVLCASVLQYLYGNESIERTTQ